MEYIEKQNVPPPEWEEWFTTATGHRSYDYGADCSALRSLPLAKEYLLTEQYYLCAYCQTALTAAQASIEHVVPKSQNKPLSTVYQNLVAVCKNPSKDMQGRRTHCDKERLDFLLPPIIFHIEAQCDTGRSHKFFYSTADGRVHAKPNLPDDIKQQVIAFINLLNLNNDTLVETRKKDVLQGIQDVFKSIPVQQKRGYLRSQYERIMLNRKQPYRQFLLTYLGTQLGMN